MCHCCYKQRIHAASLRPALVAANQNLSQALAFPLISVGPGFVGALWGVFVFGEIRGMKNFVLLTVAFLVAIVGAILITLSTLKTAKPWWS